MDNRRLAIAPASPPAALKDLGRSRRSDAGAAVEGRRKREGEVDMLWLMRRDGAGWLRVYGRRNPRAGLALAVPRLRCHAGGARHSLPERKGSGVVPGMGRSASPLLAARSTTSAGPHAARLCRYAVVGVCGGVSV
jgi:hypothetical protein